MKTKKNISFFAKPYFIGLDESMSSKPLLFRGSSLIRGEQMAEYLGAKYNPREGFENDVCIHLKPRTLNPVRDIDYVDVIDDGYGILKQLQKRPKIRVLAFSQTSYQHLKKLLKNKIILIPEHHCNFERIKRTRQKVTTGGYVGSPSPLARAVNGEIKRELKKIGFKFKTCYHFKTRQDVVNFYQKIDFQVVDFFGFFGNNKPFAHPNKIINAASFGVPTVAAWKLGYQEFKGNYLPAQTREELLVKVEKLKNKKFYDKLSTKIAKAAEAYHISQIAEKYKQLLFT